MPLNSRVLRLDFCKHYQPKAIAMKILSTKSSRKKYHRKHYQQKTIAKKRIANIITEKQLQKTIIPDKKQLMYAYLNSANKTNFNIL